MQHRHHLYHPLERTDPTQPHPLPAAALRSPQPRSVRSACLPYYPRCREAMQGQSGFVLQARGQQLEGFSRYERRA